MRRIILSLVSVGSLAWSMGAQAQTIYYLDRTIGAGSVSGTITTDGTLGPLTPANILSWSLEADDASGAHPPLQFGATTPGQGLTGDGWQFFRATDTELLFDFDAAWDDPGFDDVQFFEGGPGFSINYGFAAENTFFGKREQLVHFFDDPIPGQTHIVETQRTGLTVIATTSGRNPPDDRVVHTISFGGPDVCEAVGLPTGCDANFSGSAVLRSDGTGQGRVVDIISGDGAGIYVDIDCVFVAGNEAWLSGVITRGAAPSGFDLTGRPYIVRVQDNGDSANDQADGIRARFRSIPCYLAPQFDLYEYADGQVTVN